MADRWSGIGALGRREAIIANPEIHHLAGPVPEPPRHVGGRPRHYPPFMAIVYEAAISVFGSARRVEAEFGHPAMWQWISDRVYDQWAVRLPAAPMRRHHYTYLRNRYLTDGPILQELGAVHRRAAAALAIEVGLLDASCGGSWTHPDPDRLIYGDGKVITPLYRARPGETRLDRETGEIRPKLAEPDAALHYEGTGETAWGTKFVMLAARGSGIHSRVLLDAAYVPAPGAEAATAMACIERTAPLVPGAQAIVYDTALRGVHHQRILRDLGLLPVNRVAAAQAGSKDARRDRRHQRVEKTTFVETKTVNLPDGTVTDVQLFGRGGAIGLGTFAADGELIFQALPRVRTHRNADKGRYRWYNDYRLPPHLGGGQVTVRLHGDASDADRKFNRTENVRPIPAGDPDFQGLFRRRNDAESINRALDDTLWLRRAHSVGHRRQLLNLIGYALMVNSLALDRHRRAEPLAA